MSKQDTQTEPLRRHYAATFKRELVERSLRPGASVSGIALENGINANVLFRWRREHLRATASVQGESIEQAVLLPVRLAATVAPTRQEAATPRSPTPAGVIEIDIGAARVRVRGAVDEANVRCVLQALRTIA
ncbi:MULTISPECIES: transposase [unclassified Methylibium]|uniref:IS66-like element accessory protein TnpA n=1 Tax=unclassified Methylibium TaxID=2633235 RepID=UPI0003F3D5AD|nr:MULTISPECIES: transposase [unclassified Methylibium]EWS53729.1 Transposase [Methylibium sp. T29]EWS59873.1 Transposase [Methylibium sp. T29-B]